MERIRRLTRYSRVAEFVLLTVMALAHKAYQDAYWKGEALAMLGVAFLPPLILLLSGLVIAWIARGFARTPHQQAEA
jgi:hypothetical protein